MQFVITLRILSALLLVCCFCTLAPGQTVLLRGESQPIYYQRLKQKVTITGELLLDPHGKGVTKVPLIVAAEVDFHQRVLSDTLRVRHYTQAEAKLQFGAAESAEARVATLRDGRQTVCLTKKGGKDLYYSPTGPLTREELELIDTPAGRLDLTELLPGRKVAVGDSWQHESATLARLLNLDTIGVNEASSKLDSLAENKAVILLEGNLDGAVGGVATEIELKARYTFDLASRRVTSLALAYREKRAIAPAEPGFEVVVKLSLAEGPLKSSDLLSDSRLANLDLRTADRGGWVQFDSEHGGYRLLHDIRWRTLLDQPHTTIFRYVDRGDLLAQVNLARLPLNQAEANITLEAFTEQASKALAENLGQLIESQQYESPEGNRVIRVEATGVIEEVPMHWIYYHLNNNEGFRVSGVFTVEEKLLERFAGADRTLIDALELIPLAEPKAQPTPAKTAQRPSGE